MGALIRPATREDGPRILDLLRRTPQQGLLTLRFERDPDFFLGAWVTCEEPDVWVAEQDAELQAVFNIGRRTVFVNGEPRQVRYAHDLRIDDRARGGLLLHRMFRRLREMLQPGEWMQTVILDGNEASLSTVGSGRAGLPVYYPCGEITTSLLPVLQRRRAVSLPGVEIRRASAADLADLEAFVLREGARRQFFPCYRLSRLLDEDRYFCGLRPESFLLARRAGVLVGVMGDWDQSAFRKTRVLAYPGLLRWLRHGYNAHCALAGGLRLPPAGGCLRYRNVQCVLVQDDDADVFGALLDRLLADNRDCDALVLGLFDIDPLQAALRQYRRRELRSRHFLVSYDGDPRPALDARLRPAIEIARL